MFAYSAQRLVGALSVLFVVSVVSFGLYALTPGDPAVVLLEAAGIHSPPPDAVAAKRVELHLNDPLPVQYIQWLGGAVRGDFGRSFRSYTPVTELYLSRIGATGLLAICATLLSVVIALPLGFMAAYRRGRLADRLAQIVVALGGSMPGIGRLDIDSALVRDQPVVVGFTVAAGLIFTLMNLLVDVDIAAVDSRVRSL
jgi:peptide/nickel transport system permease protein